MMNNKSSYKLIIFDLDGTIADTSPGIFNSIKFVQKKMNLPALSKEQMYTHVGPPISESYNKNFGLVGQELEEAVAYHMSYSKQSGYKELQLYAGMKDVLLFLKSTKKKIAVATLKEQDTAQKIFKIVGLSDKIDMIVGAKMGEKKTKNQMIEFIINRCNVAKSKTVLIGDSLYDAIGAEQAGIDFIAVTYGFGFKTEDDLSEVRHIALCKKPNDLLAILG